VPVHIHRFVVSFKLNPVKTVRFLNDDGDGGGDGGGGGGGGVVSK